MTIRAQQPFAIALVGVLVAVCTVVIVPSAGAQVGGRRGVVIQNFNRRSAEVNDPNVGVYLPTDRSLSRAMARAKERLAAGEYHQALGFLHQIFQRDEDSFLDPTEGEAEQSGLKATARELIRALPPEGHEAYELLHGATARRQLDAALESGAQDRIAAVVRQYFHTWAGYEAALVLAQMEADQGHHLAAAELYQELLDTPRAAERFEPQLSIRAALNQVAASRSELAATTLRALVEKHPGATIQIQDAEKSPPRADGDLLAWLFDEVGKPRQAAPAETNWLTARGNPQRNAAHADGRPHMRPRWQARVVNDPGIEALFNSRSEEFAQRRVAMFPVARPIAVGDVVIMRTPRNVVAVDWQTGKRIWETRDDEELGSEEAISNYADGNANQQLAGQTNPLEQRTWDDALAMSLSSDGERAFVIRGVSATSQDEMVAMQMAPMIGRRYEEAAPTTNQLAAYDLATQGKLVWELDGSRTVGPLAGAFFLGAPLAVDDNLYVMAEIRSAVYLLALDPATGNVRWQQQLVGLEQGIALDATRRLIGATPSYAGGILVCPTSAGAVVGVDVVKREFAWVYRYARTIRLPTDPGNIWQQPQQNSVVRSNNRWLDGSAVIAEGRVFVTPPESDELHCLDLASGKMQWKHRRDDALIAACVDAGNLLLVGIDGVAALKVADGTAAWEQQSLPADSLPAGHGYLSEGLYYLPLTTGEIASIGVSDGTMDRFAAGRPDASFGNLICYRGSVISQSALVLDKYEQLDVLQRRAEQTLAQNSDDATALRELAELRRAEGQTAEAATLLKRAYEQDPNEPLTREVLAELLLEALASDYAKFAENLPLLSELISDRQKRIELMRIEAEGLAKLGEQIAAWEAYLRLADFTADEPEQLLIDSDYTVRSDRWIRGRLGELWSDATSKEQETITSQLAARRANLDESETTAELRHYLSHFDDLPGAGDVRDKLVQLLLQRGRLAEAEIELLQLADAKTQADRAVAAEAASQLRNDTRTKPWPTGKVIGEVKAATPIARERARRGQAEQVGYLQLAIEQDVQLGPATQWFVSADCSGLVGRNTLGDDIFQLTLGPNNWAPQYRDGNLVYAARLGHLLFASIGGHILAIDSRHDEARADGATLWQAAPIGRYPSDGYRGRRNGRTRRYRTSSPYHNASSRKKKSGAAGALLGSLGPVTPRGVVYQEQNQLRCVDPLNGEILWQRSDLPAGCELFGDGEYVIAADVAQREAHVVRLADGELVGKRDSPTFAWLMTVGRNLATLGPVTEDGNRVWQLRVIDLWSEKTLFEAEYPDTTEVSVVEPYFVAICDPTGRFLLLDVRTGEISIEQPIEAIPDLRGIETLRTGDSLFVMLNTKPQNQQHKPLSQDYPITNGPVYAFSLTTGEPIWPGPALVRNRGIVMSQPQGIPFLVFADHLMTREVSGGGRMQLRLLCLDKRTGETVYRIDNLPETSAPRFRIRGERDGESQVTVETNSNRITLAVTDQPKPPQPPANDDLEAVREIGRRGLLGLGERMLRGAISNPPEERVPQPGREVRPQLDDD